MVNYWFIRFNDFHNLKVGLIDKNTWHFENSLSTSVGKIQENDVLFFTFSQDAAKKLSRKNLKAGIYATAIFHKQIDEPLVPIETLYPDYNNNNNYKVQINVKKNSVRFLNPPVEFVYIGHKSLLEFTSLKHNISKCNYLNNDFLNNNYSQEDKENKLNKINISIEELYKKIEENTYTRDLFSP